MVMIVGLYRSISTGICTKRDAAIE